MSERVLFLDIDGVLIPSRAYVLPGQTEVVSLFDPCGVALLNTFCRENEYKIVVHSSWIRTKFAPLHKDTSVKDHCISQGLSAELFHEDWSCNGDISWRYDRVREWLSRHDVDKYVILDDELADPEDTVYENLIVTQFEDGITWEVYQRLKNKA